MTAPRDGLLYDRSDELTGTDSLSQIAKRVGPGATVLDLGAATGALGRRLREMGCTVDGVERDPDAAERARPSYRQLLQLDLEVADLREQLAGSRYDFIVCADVLEHLRDPGRILDQARELLRPDGRLLVSIPNVGYAGVIAGLLAGEFRYRPTGLLDETHLRFFTRSTLLELLSGHGFTVVDIAPLRLEIQDSEFRDGPLESVPTRVLSTLLSFPDALTYQFIVEAAAGPAEVRIAAPTPSARPRFGAQLFWTADREFTDAASSVATGTLGEAKQTIELPIPPLDRAPARLRLDVADRPGFLRVHSIALDTRWGTPVWKWSGDPSELGALHQLAHFRGPLGETWLSSGEDPSCELPVPPSALEKVKEGGVVRIVCDWPLSADYLLASQALDERESAWRRQREALLARFEALESDVAGHASRGLRPELDRLLTTANHAAAQQAGLTRELHAQARRIARLEEGFALLRRAKKVARGLARREFLFEAEPGKDVTREADGWWRAVGHDPAVDLRPLRRKLPRGWVMLDAELTMEGSSFAPPGLYVDEGYGYFESSAIRLPRPREARIRTLLRLPDTVVGLRLDPMDRPGRFRLGRVALREIGDLEAGARIAAPTLRTMVDDPRRIASALRKGVQTLQKGGIAGLRERLIEKGRPESPQVGYGDWWANFGALSDEDRQAIRARIERMSSRPLLCVVMPVYDTPERYLQAALASVRNQLYPAWQLCIADDASSAPQVRTLLSRAAAEDSRIEVVYRAKNGHIAEASNSALALARGDYVVLLDHDDELTEHALYLIAEEVLAHPDADLVYTDEDKLGESGKLYDPFFKPDWNPDLFLSQNYVSHLAAYRSELVRAVGGFRKGYEGSQDYDLCLRCIERSEPERIRHLPFVGYHWRAIEGSTASRPEAKRYTEQAARRALQEHLDHIEPGATVEVGPIPTTYRVHHPVPAPAPAVTIIVPTRDAVEVLRGCVESLQRTAYRPFELLIVDNQSRDPQTLRYFRDLEGRGIARVLPYDHPFNYSAINNHAVSQASTPLVCLLNNDIEITSADWLTEMVSHALRPGVGCVGAKLYYPDGTLQHGGVIVGLGGVAGHSHKYLPKDAPGYFWRVHLTQNLSAVTAACLVVKKSIYQQVGGLDAEHLPIAFNDVDFCLRVREAGYRNVWTPYAELIHHESKSRGAEDTAAKQTRFRSEIEYMKKRWGSKLLEDPCYNPNLTLDTENFALAWPPRVRKPWVES